MSHSVKIISGNHVITRSSPGQPSVEVLALDKRVFTCEFASSIVSALDAAECAGEITGRNRQQASLRALLGDTP